MSPRHICLSLGARQLPPLPQLPTPSQERHPACQSADGGVALLARVAAGDVQAASSTAAASSRHTDGGARGEVVGCGGVPSIDELLAARPVGVGVGYQYSAPSRVGPLLVETSGGGEMNPGDDALPDGRAATLSPSIVARESLGTDPHLFSGSTRDPHWGSHAASSSTAKAGLGTTTSASSPITRYFEAGELGSVEAGPTQLGGGLTPLGLGPNRWQARGAPSGMARSGAGSVYSRLYHDDKLLHLSPLRDPYGPQSTQPRDFRGRDSHSRLRPILPPVDTSITRPWLRRGGSDRGPPPPPHVKQAFARSPHSLPGVAEVDSTVGHRETGGLTSFSIGEVHAGSAGRRVGGDSCVGFCFDAGAGAGAGAGGCATTEGGRREHGRCALHDRPSFAALRF